MSRELTKVYARLVLVFLLYYGLLRTVATCIELARPFSQSSLKSVHAISHFQTCDDLPFLLTAVKTKQFQNGGV